jgi:hypothetical protein
MNAQQGQDSPAPDTGISEQTSRSIPPFPGYTEVYESARLATWYFPN